MAVVGTVVGTVELIEQALGAVEVAIEHAQCALRGRIREVKARKCGLVHKKLKVKS